MGLVDRQKFELSATSGGSIGVCSQARNRQKLISHNIQGLRCAHGTHSTSLHVIFFVTPCRVHHPQVPLPALSLSQLWLSRPMIYDGHILSVPYIFNPDPDSTMLAPYIKWYISQLLERQREKGSPCMHLLASPHIPHGISCALPLVRHSTASHMRSPCPPLPLPIAQCIMRTTGMTLPIHIPPQHSTPNRAPVLPYHCSPLYPNNNTVNEKIYRIINTTIWTKRNDRLAATFLPQHSIPQRPCSFFHTFNHFSLIAFYHLYKLTASLEKLAVALIKVGLSCKPCTLCFPQSTCPYPPLLISLRIM